MMGLQNLCTLFGPTLMKLSPKDNREIHVDDMSKEIKESMQQAQVLFYLLQLHAEDRLLNDIETVDTKTTDNAMNENMTKLNLKPHTSMLNEDTFKNSNQLMATANTDKNNNNLNRAHANLPENNATQQNSTPKTPSRQQANVGDKYAKLNMQTAL